MTRVFPGIYQPRTVHLIGDTHINRLPHARREKIRTDTARIAPDTFRVQVGDATVDNLAGMNEDQQFVDFMDSLGGDWTAVTGNHDHANRAATTPAGKVAEAAAAWGVATPDWVEDRGGFVIIGLSPDTWNGNGLIWRTVSVNFLDTALTAHADKPCVIVAHHPFYGTVGVAPSDVPGKKSSFDLGYYMRGELAASASVEDDKAPDMWAVVEGHPNAKAWISGHTHANRFAVDLCKPTTVAGRGFVHVNLPAPEGPTRTAFDPLITGFITMWDDRMEVRYRDHASRQWVGTGSEQRRVYTIPY